MSGIACTRRDVLTGATALFAMPQPVPDAAGDAAILGLVQDWRAVHAAHLEAIKRLGVAETALFAEKEGGAVTAALSAEVARRYQETDRFAGEECEIEREIARTPATSWRGVSEKIRLSARTTRMTNGDEPSDVADHLVESADDDITRLALLGCAT